MGTSSDGILFYGLCWDEECFKPWANRDENGDELEDDAEGFVDKLCRVMGGPERPAWDGEKHIPDLKEYWKERDAFLARHFEFEVVEVVHCSFDYLMYGMAIKKTKIRASRGYPEKVMLEPVQFGFIASLRTACEALGIDFDAEEGKGRLGWWLTSLYG